MDLPLSCSSSPLSIKRSTSSPHWPRTAPPSISPAAIAAASSASTPSTSLSPPLTSPRSPDSPAHTPHPLHGCFPAASIRPGRRSRHRFQASISGWREPAWATTCSRSRAAPEYEASYVGQAAPDGTVIQELLPLLYSRLLALARSPQLPRRTIRTSRRPSSLSISRTRRRSGTA